MSQKSSSPPKTRPRRRNWWLWLLLLLVVVGVPSGFLLARGVTSQVDGPLTWTVAPSALRITVTERGTLKSQKTVNGVCEIEGYDNKIIFIKEEGATVTKGEIVVRFDSSQIDKKIAEETLEVTKASGDVETKRQELEVARNTGASEIATAELELTLAELDLEKYDKGDYQVTLNDLQGKIALAKVDLEKAESTLKNVRELLKKGFREPEQVRVAEQEVARAKFYLRRDEETLKVTENFEHRRKLTEFKAKAEEAARKLVRAKSTAEANNKKAQGALEGAEAQLVIQKQDLAEAEKQKERCEISATQSGVVAYANEEWWSESRRIREGGTVYERQIVFYIPDMELMQVEVKIHESEVKRIAASQKAIIRVDAFANQSFTGTVKSVSQLSKSDGYFGGGVKEYTTIVVLDDKASVPLRPGMTAEVEILVDSLKDVTAVPVQAVAEHHGKHFIYCQAAEQIERREIVIGPTNNRMVVIKSGVDRGDVVTLDARSRAAKEFAGDDDAENADITSLDTANAVKAPEAKSEAAPAATPLKNADEAAAVKSDAAVSDPGEKLIEKQPAETPASETAAPATVTPSATESGSSAGITSPKPETTSAAPAE